MHFNRPHAQNRPPRRPAWQWLGVWIAAVLAIVAGQASAASAPAIPATVPSAAATPAAIIQLSGEIDNFSRDALKKNIVAARAAGARTILLQINTYGGLVTAGLDMSRFLKSQNDLHLIAYVDDKAISAGAMIALACDEIVMAPSATLGDSAPIALSSGGGLNPLPPTERAKIQSPILADFDDSAARHGYDPALVEAMVVVDHIVYWVQDAGGNRRFVAPAERTELLAKGWSDVPGVAQPIDSAERLLTVHTRQAIQFGLASGQSASAQALAAERHLQIVGTFAPSAGDAVVNALGSHMGRFALFTVFLLSLYIALHAPGHGLAEAVALTSLGALLGVPLLTGYAQWWEIIVMLVGLGLLALELFVIPGFGVAGISGIVLFLGGLILTFVGREPSGLPGIFPHLPATWSSLQSGMIVVIGGLVCSALLSQLLRSYLPKLPYFNRLILTTAGGGELPVAEQDHWPFTGTLGQAVTDLRPGGSAEFPYADATRIAAVVSDSGFVAKGTNVVVRETGGNRVLVRPLPSVEAPTPPKGAAE
jgi:membrane-bound serine protease (ClpP class)